MSSIKKLVDNKQQLTVLALFNNSKNSEKDDVSGGDLCESQVLQSVINLSQEQNKSEEASKSSISAYGSSVPHFESQLSLLKNEKQPNATMPTDVIKIDESNSNLSKKQATSSETFDSSGTSFIRLKKHNSSLKANAEKTKRCTDRYDSSESSDSGVATSVSCTDSNIGSNEDASEPNSPLSGHLGSCDDLQHLPKTSIKIVNEITKMSPQTLKEINASVISTPPQNLISVSVSNMGRDVSGGSTVVNSSKLKLPVEKGVKKSYNDAKNATMLPVLQWPWNSTAVGTGTHSSQVQAKKRLAAQSNGGDYFLSKKARSCAAVSILSNTDGQTVKIAPNSNGGANVSKRLRNASLEESQTKITGYFKSQMKLQMPLNNGSAKQTGITNSPVNGVSSKTSCLKPNNLAMNAPATTASLNKYFNVLAQIKENNGDNRLCSNIEVSNESKVDSPEESPPLLAPQRSATMPALKKIERSKPTKIAQVAPNLRKVSSSSSYNNALSSAEINGKSPIKRHVAIAPRTPEMKQQSKPVLTKPEGSKSFAAAHQPTNSSSQPPTVLLTAIRLPPSQPTASKQVCQVAKSTPHATPSNANTAVANTTSGSATVYQLPLQIPNLVQLPHLLATNNSNMMQLNNIGPTSAVAKAASTNTTPAATTSAQAAQSAASQYFLNGTVFKLQQFTTATTTTATSAASSNPNPFNFLSASDLQELILKQQQQQQKAAITTTTTSFQEIFQQQIAAAVAASQQQQAQFQQLQRMNNAANISQPVFMTTPAGLLLNAASLPTMLAQAAAVIAVSNQQSQQQKAIALPALQPIQQNPLPALSSIFAPQTQQPEQSDIQQQQIAQLALTQQQQQFITSTQPPPLSSVTLNISNNLSPLQTALQKQPQSVAPKLTLVKATASPTSYPTLNSQPPPLVTISNAKGRSHLVTHATTVNSSSNLCTKALIQKQSAQTKPYQKNTTKLAATHSKIANPHVNKVKTSKIGMTSGKIFATSTTPPPLVPTIQTKALQVVASKANLISSRPSSNCVSQPSALFTPSLVSIVNTAATPRISKDAFNSTGVAKAHIDKTAILSKSKSCGYASVSNSSSATIESTDTSVSFSNVCNKLLEKLEGNDSKIVDKPKPTADLFDLIKNSKSVPSEVPKNISRKPLPLSNSFYEIKDEPLEESSALAIISGKKCNDFKETDLVSSTNIKGIDIKKEQINANASENEKIHDVIHQENSSSSFSSHTNSTSSRTDLSLDTSTLTTISATPSSCSGSMQATSPNSNLQLCMINNSTPLTCVAGVLSHDTLSEMVAVTCSLPESEESSINMSSNTFRDKALAKETQNRVLPSPESGICGSFSRNESSDSCAKSPTTLCATSVAQLRQLSGKEKRVFSNSESINVELPVEYHITSEAAICPIDTKLTEAAYILLPKSTISPILSQPKTIRFPPESRCFLGTKTGKRSDGVCHWNKCNQKYESNSKLLDHMQNQHVNIQTGPFSCLWVGCKVYNKESCSRRWLERHVLSHGGSKQFKCIVEGCGLRFGSQLALQKHVNNHFTATESKEGSNKRTSDPPVPKQLRKNGKKLRYRRQPFSARMFDFFDAGIMEALQHRLRQISTLTNGYGCITFQGQCVLRRKTFAGSFECFIRWSPGEIISDEWLPESEEPYVKTVNIKQMQPVEKNKVENLLMTAFKLPYSPGFFECEARLSKQNLQSEYDNDSTTTSDSDDGKCINDLEEKTPPASCPLTNYISDHRTTICEGVQKERKQRRKSLRHFI